MSKDFSIEELIKRKKTQLVSEAEKYGWTRGLRGTKQELCKYIVSNQPGSLDCPAYESRIERRLVLESDRELFDRFWSSRKYDQSFHKALAPILSQLDADMIVAHISGRTTRIAFSRPTFRIKQGQSEIAKLRDEVYEKCQEHLDLLCKHGLDLTNELIFLPNCLSNFHVAFTVIPEDADDDAHDDHTDTNWCAILSSKTLAKQGVEPTIIDRTLRMVYSVIRRRERRFACFPPRISEQYWEDAADLMSDESGRNPPREKLQPPWETPEKATRTVTLSLDLRKSTFCMAQVDNPHEFAQWLDELVDIVTQVSHLHGGVFDKFTGDGCLVHFLQRDYCLVYGPSKSNGNRNKKRKKRKGGIGTAQEHGCPLHAALDCAADMQRAMKRHLHRLRRHLRMDSDLLGAGVAIGYADAFWSFDHHDNPIVVGQGVVDACRLCDKALSGQIMLANNAYRQLSPALRHRLNSFERKLVETKELDQDIKVAAWVLGGKSARPVDLGTSKQEIRDLCKRVYNRSKARRNQELGERCRHDRYWQDSV